MGEPELVPGDALGRFQVIRSLGAGGMGQVYLAHDPELHREVAVKVLHADVVGPHAEAAARGRLKREAQAMAAVNHPNVVSVYEVEDDGERLLVVMELITGGTLREWARSRKVAEIVAMFRQAGAGLAAAHAAGLVHRDFKPENVLVDAHGRARVTDFGLVGAEEAPVDLVRSGALGLALTHTGAVLGTPPYMAPEQHRGEPATARSDQFGFCVALYELLYGRRPFPDTSYRELLAAVLEGEPTPPPRTPRVDARVRRAIVRGLARDPAERFASMSELCAELAPPRGRVAVIASIGGVVAAGAIVAAFAWPHDDAPRTLPDAGVAPPPPAPPPPSAPPVALTELGGCAEAPVFVDDHTIVFDRSLGDTQDLYSVPVAGGTARRLTSGPDHHWNPRPGPAAGEVTYVHEIGDRVLGARLDAGSASTDLAIAEGFDPGPGVAPVAGGFAYVPKGDTEIRLFAKGTDRALIELPKDRVAYQIGASRDGRWLAIDTARTQGVCLVDTAAATPTPDCRSITGSVFGTWFTSDGAHYYHASSSGIARYDTATGTATQVTTLAVGGNLTVSSDEHTLVYSDCSARSRVLDLSHGAPVELVAGRIKGPAVAPGDRIVFGEQRRDGEVLVVREPDGSTRDLTSGALGTPTTPAWDATGQRIVFRLAGKGIFVVAASGGPPIQLTDDESDLAPRFLGDGRVVFTRLDDQQVGGLWIVDTAGGVPKRASNAERWVWDVDRKSGRVLLSDQSWAHFFWWDPATGAETGFAALDSIAKREVQFPDVAVALDGSAVYAPDGDRVLWKLPVAGGKPVRVFEGGDTYDWLDRPLPLAGGVAVTAQFWAGELYRYQL